MAVTSLKTGSTNADGLRQYFGTAEGKVTRGGEVDFDGRHMTRVVIDLTTLNVYSGSDEMIVADNVAIPAGALIEQVDVLVLKETAGVNANLDLGFVKASDRSTEIDFNGLLAAADAFNGGTDLGTLTTYVVGTTEAGALIGTRLAYTGLVTASADTADFSAGIIEVRIYWSVPLSADV